MRLASSERGALNTALIRYQGHVGAYLVLGGVDATGAHLFSIAAHGSTDKLPYMTLGSGSLAAMAVFESSFKEHMKVSPLNLFLHLLQLSSGIVTAEC